MICGEKSILSGADIPREAGRIRAGSAERTAPCGEGRMGWRVWGGGPPPALETEAMDDTPPHSTLAAPAPNESPADCVARIGALAEIRRTRFDGGEMVWRVWGGGRPVVLLHGGYGAWSHWIRNVLPLAGRFRVIAADMPSHGDSETLPGRPDRIAMSRAIAQGLRRILDAEQPYDIVGFSMGANLAAAVASFHGGGLRRLVVVGPGGLGVPSKKIEGLRRWRPDMPREELDTRHRNNLRVIMFRDATRIDDLAVHIQRENGLRMRFRAARTGINTVLRDYLPAVSCTLSCIWGDADAYADGGRNARIAAMRRSHPNLAVGIVPDAGHWVMYEQPQAFNRELFKMLGVDDA